MEIITDSGQRRRFFIFIEHYEQRGDFSTINIAKMDEVL